MNKRPPKMWEISLGINKYLQFIKTGEKTVEGRINQGIFKSIQIGDGIKFYNPKDSNDFIVCIVVEIRAFISFKEMLLDFGFESLIPDAHSLKESIKLYESIPGFQERCKEFGCVGIKVDLLKDAKTKI